MDGTLYFHLLKLPYGEDPEESKLDPRIGPLNNLKSLNHGLSNVLRTLELGFSLAQTWSFFDKLWILASYNNLRICEFLQKSNIKSDHAIIFDMPRKVFI